MGDNREGLCAMPGCKKMLYTRNDVACREHWDSRISGGPELYVQCPVCLHSTQPATIRAERGDYITCDECGSIIALHVGRSCYVIVPGGKTEVGDSSILRLKIWPSYYLAIESGKLKCQWRRDEEEELEEGKKLILEEWDPGTRSYTGKEMKVEITHVIRGPQFQIPDSFAIVSIQPERKRERDRGRDESQI